MEFGLYATKEWIRDFELEIEDVYCGLHQDKTYYSEVAKSIFNKVLSGEM